MITHNTLLTTDSQISVQTIARLLSGQITPEEVPDSHWKPLFLLADHHEALPLLVGQFATYFRQHNEQALRQYSVLALKWQSTFRPLLETAQHLNQLLRTSNKQAIWLKGIALGFEYYPHAWMRKMADIDIWVEKQSLDSVLNLLVDNGYELDPTFGGNHLDSDQFANHYTLTSANGTQVELHFDLIQPRLQMLTPEENSWFWTHTQEIESPIGTLCVLQPEANFLHLAYHDIIMHDMLDVSTFDESSISLKRKYDLYLLVTQSQLDWELIHSQSQKLGWTFAVQQALRQLETYFAWNPPDHVKLFMDADTHQLASALTYSESEKRLIGKWQTFLRLPTRVKARYLHTMLFPTRHKLHWAYPDLDHQSYLSLLFVHYKTGIQTVWKFTSEKNEES